MRKYTKRSEIVIAEMKKIIKNGIKDLCLDDVQCSLLSFVGRFNEHSGKFEIYFTYTELYSILLELNKYLFYVGYPIYKTTDCSYFKRQFEFIREWLNPITHTDLYDDRVIQESLPNYFRRFYVRNSNWNLFWKSRI